MSQLGHNRRKIRCPRQVCFRQLRTSMSARCPHYALQADLRMSWRQVANGPKPAVSNRQQTKSLFDHLVGECEQRRRDVETECPCSLEIDHEFELGRQDNWKFAGLLAV